MSMLFIPRPILESTEFLSMFGMNPSVVDYTQEVDSLAHVISDTNKIKKILYGLRYHISAEIVKKELEHLGCTESLDIYQADDIFRYNKESIMLTVFTMSYNGSLEKKEPNSGFFLIERNNGFFDYLFSLPFDAEVKQSFGWPSDIPPDQPDERPKAFGCLFIQIIERAVRCKYKLSSNDWPFQDHTAGDNGLYLCDVYYLKEINVMVAVISLPHNMTHHPNLNSEKGMIPYGYELFQCLLNQKPKPQKTSKNEN